MAGIPAPGWYPDPQDPAVLRWWDGARWSGETRLAAGAPGGPAPPSEAGADPFAQMGFPVTPAAEESLPGQPGDPRAAWREPALQFWAAEYRAAGSRPAQASPARAWLIGGAAAAVVAGLAVWLLVALLAGGR